MRQGKTEIERLFKSYYEPMYRVARSLLYDADECRDVVSEVFAHVLDDGIVLLPESEEGYLVRAVRNRCLNIIAHKDIRERTAKLLLADAETILSDNDSDLLDRLMLLIEHLEPPIRRQILRLRHLQGIPLQRIAEETGVSRVTVCHHLSAAIDTIREQLKQARQ
ncbi:MAG: sigma-70 family RNA polymerase sigma factor [Prevotella sp.]|nr:sigma-70 family RNA polymerase sigma factor [Prevotella sp.]